MLIGRARPKCLPVWKPPSWPLTVNHFLLSDPSACPLLGLSTISDQGPGVCKRLLTETPRHKFLKHRPGPDSTPGEGQSCLGSVSCPFIHPTKANPGPSQVPLTLPQTPVLCPAHPGGAYKRGCDSPSPPAGDNKPIWMHAEEREESKVAPWGRAGAGTRGESMRRALCRGPSPNSRMSPPG